MIFKPFQYILETNSESPSSIFISLIFNSPADYIIYSVVFFKALSNSFSIKLSTILLITILSDHFIVDFSQTVFFFNVRLPAFISSCLLVFRSYYHFFLFKYFSTLILLLFFIIFFTPLYNRSGLPFFSRPCLVPSIVSPPFLFSFVAVIHNFISQRELTPSCQFFK